jgi:hypothetical protein
MAMKTRMKPLSRGTRACVALLVAALGGGCGLTDVTIPELSGPSGLAFNMRVRIEPDVLTADGISSAVVIVEASGPDGSGVANRQIFFAIADAIGTFADIGSLSADRAFTDGSGVARVVYRVPPRTDFTANGSIIIAARPVGDDATGQIYRTARLEIRSAEPRLFPPNDGNALPNCSFATEFPDGPFVGRGVLFQTTSSDEDGIIVRYAWDFGDGTRDDKPDVVHIYKSAGVYTVFHKVTDNNGGEDTCDITFAIAP